jgi:hypothetical protein
VIGIGDLLGVEHIERPTFDEHLAPLLKQTSCKVS